MTQIQPGISSLDGIFLVNKPSGPSSYDMIRWIKRSVGKAKIGHSGTLDPLASGLLIILFGKATKSQSLLMALQKTYRCRFRMGIKTDSADITGKVIEEKPVPKLTQKIIENKISGFTGDQEQIPPMYSALKKDGIPLYKLARKGEVVDRKPRKISIYSIEFLDFNSESGEIEIRVVCSAGTYVRTLVEDIASALGSCGTLISLVREQIGAFSVLEAVSGDLISGMSVDDIHQKLIKA